MTNDKALAIAASAYNVCGPQSGDAATPSTLGKFGRATVLDCMDRYVSAHDGELFTADEIRAARALVAG